MRLKGQRHSLYRKKKIPFHFLFNFWENQTYLPTAKRFLNCELNYRVDQKNLGLLQIQKTKQRQVPAMRDLRKFLSNSRVHCICLKQLPHVFNVAHSSGKKAKQSLTLQQLADYNGQICQVFSHCPNSCHK